MEEVDCDDEEVGRRALKEKAGTDGTWRVWSPCVGDVSSVGDDIILVLHLYQQCGAGDLVKSNIKAVVPLGKWLLAETLVDQGVCYGVFTGISSRMAGTRAGLLQEMWENGRTKNRGHVVELHGQYPN